jgi:hypothetical protein
MLSGRRLNLLDPSPLDIEIEDIAHGLARVARWNGQTLGAQIYSVAQHSLLVDAIAGHFAPSISMATRRAVFLHDAAEYVIGDIISPFKSVIGEAYRETESRILEAVMRRFELPAPMTKIAHDLAKKADRAAAYLEATRLAGFSESEANDIFGAPPPFASPIYALLNPWGAEEAKSRFLTRFAELTPVARA